MILNNVLSSTAIPGTVPYQVKTGSASSLAHDWELAGVALNDPSQGLQVKVWHFELIGDDVTVANSDVPRVTLFTALGITEIAGAFDQNMNPFVAYMQAGTPKIYWYDPTLAAMTHTSITAGSFDLRCTMDEKRTFNVSNSDIILAYIRGTTLYFRMQRDRYTIERALLTNAGIVGLNSVAMNTGLRLQWCLKGTLV